MFLFTILELIALHGSNDDDPDYLKKIYNKVQFYYNTSIIMVGVLECGPKLLDLYFKLPHCK